MAELKDLIPEKLSDKFLEEGIYTIQMNNNGFATIKIDTEKLLELLIPKESISKVGVIIDIPGVTKTFTQLNKRIFDSYKEGTTDL